MGIDILPKGGRTMYYVGLDIHKKNTQACVKNENGKVISSARFQSDVDHIGVFLDRLGTAKAKIAMEATGFYEFIYDAIEARGYEVVLAHPLKLKALTAGRAKTDRNDAEMLAELLRINAIPCSYVPPKEVRRLRDLTRHRESLMMQSTRMKNKIRAELARLGIVPPKDARSSFSKKFVRWLRSLGNPVVDDHLDILEIPQQKIGKAEKEIEEESQDDEELRLLQTIPGVGHIVASTVKAEVGNLSRFRSAEALASYAGLIPALRQSGERSYSAGMSRHGNSRLRYVLTEAVHVHVMFCEESRLTAFFRRKKEEKGGKKATVATAKKLIEVMYAMALRKEEFHAH